MRSPTKSSRRPDRLRVGQVLLRLTATALLLGVMASIGLLMILPRVTGATPLTVLTGSMTPEIPVGSAVFIRPVDTDTLRPGDIATYQREEGVASFITHRVVKVNSEDHPDELHLQGRRQPRRGRRPGPRRPRSGARSGSTCPTSAPSATPCNGKAGLTLLAILVLGRLRVSQFWGAFRDRRRPATAPAHRRSRRGPLVTACWCSPSSSLTGLRTCSRSSPTTTVCPVQPDRLDR